MLKPNFLLTKKISLTVYRKTQGSWVNGDWVEGTVTEVPVQVNIQPLKDNEILQMPEADRSRQWYKLYSGDVLLTEIPGASGNAADEFDWQGYRFKIMSVRRYDMGTLDHFRALAARVEVSAI